MIICFLILFIGIKEIQGKEINEINSLSNFIECSICEEYDWFPGHKCPPQWKKHIELSYINISGTTITQTLSGKLDIRKENKRNRYFIKSNIRYGENYDNDSKTCEKIVNKWSLNGKYEKIFTGKLFGFLSINYIDDEFSGYNYRALIGPGCGYDIVKTKRHYLKGLLSTLYSYDRFIKLEDNKKSDSYGSGKMAVDYIWHLSKNLTFKEMADYLHSFEDNEKYFINSETVFEIKINTFMSFGLSYIVNYQNDLPSSYKDIKHTEKTFLTSIIIDL